jgi:hypothetical protein
MTSKPQKRKLKKTSSATTHLSSLVESKCKDKIIWDLYNECFTKRRSRKIKNIKLYLQDVDYPLPIIYAQKVLEVLKTQKIIENYKIETAEQALPPMVLEDYSNPDIEWALLISVKDSKKIPKKYLPIDLSQIDYMVNIECYPQTVIKCLKGKFKIIDQIKQGIIKRENIENSFKKEQVLECSGLRLGLETGNAIYGETITNFLPNGQEYLLLKDLMEKPNQTLSYNEISDAIRLKDKVQNPSKKDRRDISFIVRNIKRKLEMVGSKRKNKDIIYAHNGYRIVRD